MTSNECLLHIDFSENYCTKVHREIQSVHFGASEQQVSLHTEVLYIAHDDKPQIFCSMSDSLQHGPTAIWAHFNQSEFNVRFLIV